MNRCRIILSFLVFFMGIFLRNTQVFAYSFGLYPEENNTTEIVELEKKYQITNNVVGYIFDTFSEKDRNTMKQAFDTLGKNRVYHVSISPFGFSAQDVADGKYDAQYRRFFSLVRASRVRVLFRTMHEMNGSWYSWSGNPEAFKKAWKHVYALSREEWLDSTSILFIMSMNSEDLPSKDHSVWGELVFCAPEVKEKLGCYSFEDYYPGSEYVDLMGMTLYNWWRGRNELWAKWRSFSELLLNPSTHMFERLKSYNKPIFLDEVGTTAVDFSGKWSVDRILLSYEHDVQKKNEWIAQMKKELFMHPQIAGVLYFNRDKTNGLRDERGTGELDWSAISLRMNKVYSSIFGFFSDPNITLATLPFKTNIAIAEGRRYGKKMVAELAIIQWVAKKEYAVSMARKKVLAAILASKKSFDQYYWSAVKEVLYSRP